MKAFFFLEGNLTASLALALSTHNKQQRRTSFGELTLEELTLEEVHLRQYVYMCLYILGVYRSRVRMYIRTLKSQ